MRRYLVALLAPFLAAASLRAQTTTAIDPDHIDLGLKEVSVTLPIAHWKMLDGKPDPKITPYPNITFTLDSAAHKVTLKGPPVDVQNAIDLLRFLDRDISELTTKSLKLKYANPSAVSRLLNDFFAPKNGYMPGKGQLFSIPAADGESILVSGWKPGFDLVASFFERLDAAPSTTNNTATEPTKMLFQFEDASVDDIFKSMEKEFGMIIIRPDPPITTKVTIGVSDRITQDQSIKLLNSLLTQIGHVAYQYQMIGADKRAILRVQVLIYNKGRIPVNFGADASRVSTSDNLITQVIPLFHAKAADIKKELEAIASPDADLTINIESNSIVITDTSAKIHALLEKLPALDK